jgi:hypothetical protein
MRNIRLHFYWKKVQYSQQQTGGFMNKIFLLSTLALSLNLNAATLSDITAPSHSGLEDLVKTHRQFSTELEQANASSCGLNFSMKIVKKDPSENFKQTIKQAIHRHFGRLSASLDEVAVYQSSSDEVELILRATNAENFDFEGSDELIHKFDTQLENYLASSTEDLKEHLLTFTGDQQGSFTSGGFIALVNTEAMELTVLGAGYCE